jgi:hypothetical protein
MKSSNVAVPRTLERSEISVPPGLKKGKTMKPPQFLLQTGLLLLSVWAVSAPAFAQYDIPFVGAFTDDGAQTSNTLVFPIIHQTDIEHGVATVIGRFTYTDDIYINLLPLTIPDIGNVMAFGAATWTAPNGDSISTTMMGDLLLPDATRLVNFYTIVGGSGRFSGAAGNFIIVQDLAYPLPSGINPNPRKSSIKGTISFPNGKKS